MWYVLGMAKRRQPSRGVVFRRSRMWKNGRGDDGVWVEERGGESVERTVPCCQ